MLKAERDENTCRKDFAPSEAVALGERLEKLLRPEAEKRRAEAIRKRDEKGRAKSSGGKLPQVDNLKTRDAVGAAVGLSGRTYEKAKAVVEAVKVDPSLKPILEEMDRTGNVEKAFRAQKKAALVKVLDLIAKEAPATVDGTFDVLVIANKANVGDELFLNAMAVLQQPDRNTSLPQPYEGRRIEAVEGGWLILNGAYYQNLMCELNRRARWAAQKREQRARTRNGKPLSGESAAVRAAEASEEDPRQPHEF